MRIAFYADNFYPELSGITDTIITTTKRLKARGHEILYVAPYYAPGDYTLAGRQYPAKPEDDAIDGMRIVRLPSMHMPASPTGQSRFAFPTGASLKAVTEFKPDVIHVHSPYGTGLEAAKVAKALGVPLIGTNHTAIEDFFPPGLRSIMRRWDARFYNRCSFVSAPYAKLIARMRQMGFTKEGHAVPNPADLHEFTSPTMQERLEHKTAMGLPGPVLLYCGRLGVEKRVDVLVRAMPSILKRFPTATFLATGHGAARPSLERLVQKLGIGKHVRFTGYLSRAALPHAYQAADLFWMASTSDSQSLALMQGYSSALPAVCADARGLPDYTPKEAGFLAPAGDHETFAARAIELLEDDSKRATMGAAAVQFAKKFEPDLIADTWEKIYTEAISTTKR